MSQPQQLLQQTQPIDIFRPSIFEFAANIFIALSCGVLISLVYRFIRRKSNLPPAFPNALVLLSLITAIVTLVIGNNLARAFGLVGTMSIIRFRTAVRDVEDIVFIFFSLTMGMAAGVGLNSVAIIGTIVICVTILLLHALSDTETPEVRRGFLQVAYASAEARKTVVMPLLKKYARRNRLLSERQLAADAGVDAFYRVVLRKGMSHKEFIGELEAAPQVSSAQWVFEDEELNANG